LIRIYCRYLEAAEQIAFDKWYAKSKGDCGHDPCEDVQETMDLAEQSVDGMNQAADLLKLTADDNASFYSDAVMNLTILVDGLLEYASELSANFYNNVEIFGTKQLQLFGLSEEDAAIAAKEIAAFSFGLVAGTEIAGSKKINDGISQFKQTDHGQRGKIIIKTKEKVQKSTKLVKKSMFDMRRVFRIDTDTCRKKKK
jgi:hypothetical protein